MRRRKPIPCADEADPQTVPVELVSPCRAGTPSIFDGSTSRSSTSSTKYRRASAMRRATARTSPRDQHRTLGRSRRGAFTAENATTGSFRSYYIGKYELTEPQWRLFEAGLLAPERGAIGTKAEACREHNAWLAEVDLVKCCPRRGYPGTTPSPSPALQRLALEHRPAAWSPRVASRCCPGSRGPRASSGCRAKPNGSSRRAAAQSAAAGKTGRAGSIWYATRERADRRAGTQQHRLSKQRQCARADQRVGRRRSNLLDLYDMVGNAEEVVPRPFSGGATTVCMARSAAPSCAAAAAIPPRRPSRIPARVAVLQS